VLFLILSNFPVKNSRVILKGVKIGRVICGADESFQSVGSFSPDFGNNAKSLCLVAADTKIDLKKISHSELFKLIFAAGNCILRCLKSEIYLKKCELFYQIIFLFFFNLRNLPVKNLSSHLKGCQKSDESFAGQKKVFNSVGSFSPDFGNDITKGFISRKHKNRLYMSVL